MIRKDEPKRTEKRTETHACDLISRQAAIDEFINGLEEIFADLRERHVDDSVCGLCEYDGAYMGQSGNWCNECPGFERDDCFKLSDETRKKWKAQLFGENTTKDATSDSISRQWLMECVNEGWIKFDTEKDENRFIHLVRDIAPSAQPERKGRWIDGQCSICGCDIPAYIIDWKWQKDMDAKFCPNCGARMEGE